MQIEQYNPNIIDPSDLSPRNDKKEESVPIASENKNLFGKLNEFFCDGRIRIALGAVLALFGAYLLIVIVSYFIHGESDQSKILNHTVMEIARSADKVSNTGSSLGAKMANFLIAEGVGISAFIIVIWCFTIGYRMLMRKKVYFFTYTFVSLVSLIACTMIVGACTQNLGWLFFPLGGNFGKYANLLLIDIAGFPGMVIVNVLLAVVWILLCWNSLKNIYSNVHRYMPKHKPISETDSENDTVDIDSSEADLAPFAANQAQTEEEPITTAIPLDIPIEPIPKAASVESDILPKNDETEAKSMLLDDTKIKTAPKIEVGSGKTTEAYDPTKELSKYKFPTLDLLRKIPIKAMSVDVNEQEENKKRITDTLNSYGIAIKKIEVCVGPTITLFEIIPADGVRISKIKNLEDDIALSLAALGIRIIAPIPGRGTIGIEVPNKEPQTVSMRSVIESKKFQEFKGELPMAVGCTISNDVYIADLVKMPHLLVAGATGQGKSVGLNAIITSLLYKKHPAELKFVLIDPKMVEFSLYSMLEHHYLAKLPDEEKCIITEPSKVVATLNSLVTEMEDRYRLLQDAKERNVKDYNRKFINHSLNPEKGHRYLPYIVVVIDEFCDLIMMAGKDVEMPIVRIAQKARAVGIHMIIATQRPSTNVITGIIKANFPGRIAFRVTQMVDSRTILDCSGAQQLIGKGDMLFSANGNIDRIQCAFVDTPEVEAICEHIGNQVGYEEAYELPPYVPEDVNGDGMSSGAANLNDRDPYFEEAAAFIISGETASTSSLQRRFGIGYNRAGRMMDQMEAAGIVSASQGGKPRKVLIDSIQLGQILEH